MEEVGNGKVRSSLRKFGKEVLFLPVNGIFHYKKRRGFLGFKLELRESDYRVLFKEAIRSVVDKLRSA